MRPLPVTTKPEAKKVDDSILTLVTHWRLVQLDLIDRGVNLHDERVRSGSWLAVRDLIFSLFDEPSRLRSVLLAESAANNDGASGSP